MLMPSIFGENLIDDFFGFDHPYRGYQKVNTTELMNTDVREHDTGYELDISLPGYKKEDIRAELKDGYLTISAKTSRNNDQKDESVSGILLFFPSLDHHAYSQDSLYSLCKFYEILHRMQDKGISLYNLAEIDLFQIRCYILDI